MCAHVCVRVRSLAYALRTHTHALKHTRKHTRTTTPPYRPPPGMPSLARPPVAGPSRGDVDSPLFLNPRGAKTLRTPRMKERESKSQRGGRQELRMPLDVLVATDRVCSLPSLCTPRVRRTTGVQGVLRACRRAQARESEGVYLAGVDAAEDSRGKSGAFCPG